jgi:hypothetical protein
MSGRELPVEQVVGCVDENGEVRKVSLLEAESLAVIERSAGPVTEVAYGSPSHGHKMLASRSAYAHVLGVSLEQVVWALGDFFVVHGEGGGAEYAQLGSLMDRFDAAGEKYAYIAWDGDSNVAYRGPQGE